MVFDPLSALTLASSIVQFVDFSSRLLSGATELYHVKTGTLPAYEELELISNDIISVNKSYLDKSHPDPTIPPLARIELNRLAEACNNLAQELLILLHKSRAQSHGKALQSIRQAFLNLCRERKISDYMERLKNLRLQTVTHMVVILRLVYVALSAFSRG